MTNLPSDNHVVTHDRSIPFSMQDEDGARYWIEGHVDRQTAVLASLIYTMVDVGMEEAAGLLWGDATEYGVRLDRAAQLLQHVSHVWMRLEEDSDLMWRCEPDHPDALAYTVAGTAVTALPVARRRVRGAMLACGYTLLALAILGETVFLTLVFVEAFKHPDDYIGIWIAAVGLAGYGIVAAIARLWKWANADDAPEPSEAP